MILREHVIYLVCADPALTQTLLTELMAAGENLQLPLARSVLQARGGFQRAVPTAILLDESAVDIPAGQERASGALLEAAVAALTEFAPVVVIAAPERQEDLAFLITSGAVDFVGRVGNFVPFAAGLLERRVRLAQQAAEALSAASAEPDTDFAELLRHEVNNPLTGILGNAELLLGEFRKKNSSVASSASMERLETIAELAVRLRDTVRRISDSWNARHDHARSA